jgi:hypothetical protein
LDGNRLGESFQSHINQPNRRNIRLRMDRAGQAAAAA